MQPQSGVPTPPNQPNPNYQQQPPAGLAPTGQEWQPNAPKGKKKIIIALSVVLVIVFALTVILPHLTGKSSDNKSTDDLTSDSNMYHFRDGYDIKEYGSRIGDPLALNMSKLDKVFKSSVGPIVYACNILSVNDINSQKAYLSARADAKAVERNYIDGVGKQGIKTEAYSLADGDKGNDCTYSLESGGLLSVDVYQPPFTANAAIQDQLSRTYTKSGDVGGLAAYVYSKGSKDTNQYMLVSGQEAISVLFNGTKLAQDKKDALLAKAAANFIDQQRTGKGPAIAVYDTPTFKKPYAKACDFISNDDIKALTGNDASLYVNEGLASGTGVAKVDNTLYNSISTSCARFNTDLGSGLTAGPFDQKLEVDITSYNSDIAAKFDLQTSAKNLDNKISASIGDEGYGYRDSAGQNTVMLRQGRFVVQMILDRTVQANAGLQDTATMTQKLTLYAQQVAAKLKSME